MKVLLIDDESSMTDQTKIFLEKEDERLNVDTASSAKEGLELFDKDDYDAIVSDYMMPEVDGLELLKIIRKDRNSDIPFIIFTGRGREDVAMDALNLGANRYLRKGGDPKSQYGVLAQSIIQEVEHHRTSKEKVRGEAKLLSMLNSSEDLIYIVDKNCRMLFANEAELDYHGLDQDEITDYRYQDLHNEEDSKRFEEKVNKVFQTGKPQRQDIKHSDDGKYYAKTLSPITDPLTGEVEGVSVISRDITRRKKMEEKYKALFDQLTDALFLEDTEGRIVDVNDAACDLLGYDYEELLGMKVADLVPEGEPAFLPGEIDKATREGKPLETKNKRRDGSVVPIELRGRIIELEKEKRMLISVRDITERKKAERKYERLFNSAPDMIAEVDEDGRFLTVNQALADSLDSTPQEIAGKTHWDLMPDRVADKRVEMGLKAIEDEEVIIFEDERNDRYFQHYYTPLKANGKKRTFQVISRDVTEQREVKKREEFLHSLLRHDVKNKTQIVNGYINFLLESDISGKEREYAEKALQACNEGSEIIEKVRTLRQIVKEEEIGEVNVRRYIEDAIDDNAIRASEKDIDIKCKDVDFKVQGGPLLEELFSNLIENAIVHSGCDNIRLSGEEEDDYIYINLEDDGRGIPDESKRKIFRKGFKEGSTAQTGLGTYLVKEIAEGYGGDVDVKDSELGGAGFEVILRKL